MSGDCPCRKVEQADRDLYELSNALSLWEYRQDRGDEKAGSEIAELRGEIKGLLGEPSLPASAHACREVASIQGDRRLERKAELLEREITFSSIENSHELLRAKDAVRQKASAVDRGRIMHVLGKEADRTARRRALEELARGSAMAEEACRELVNLCNNLAHGQGYADYAEAKLAYEGLTVDELRAYFAQWRDQFWPRWERALYETSRAQGDAVKPHDLVFMLRARRGRPLDLLPRGGGIGFLRELLRRLGVALDTLPLTIEERDLGFSGACYRVRPGEDIRIVLDTGLNGFQEHFYLLHEFGHAVYYCFCPVGSELLLDNHLVREIMADLWPQFLNEPRVLAECMGLAPEQARAVADAQRAHEALGALLLMRDAMFTLEALQRPEVPFDELWRGISNDWLGIDDTSGAFPLSDFLHPLDMKSYVFAQVLSEQAFATLASGSVTVPDHPVVFEQMIERFYRPGSTIDWRQKLGL